MKQVTFSGWLIQAFELANKQPVVWLGSVVFLTVILALGRISLALQIVVSISCLFVSVGVIDAIDRGSSDFWKTIKRHLPLACLLATVLMLLWFLFRMVANFNTGETEKIWQFFFYWELSEAAFEDKTLRQIMLWLYSAAIVSLVFVILMLNSFASWFSYPLMIFDHKSWSDARDVGRQAFADNAGEMYKLNGFLLITAFVGIGLVPLLTPLFYMLVSTLMYVSYKDIFVNQINL